jgi:hypothetical protein
MARKPPALAKITPPRLHDVLARTRLFDALDAALQPPVAWLSAQPGAGKTTLVATYLQARTRRVLWYQVDDGDADAASFIYHLRLAAQARDAAAGGRPARARQLPGALSRTAFDSTIGDHTMDIDVFQPHELGTVFRVLRTALNPDAAALERDERRFLDTYAAISRHSLHASDPAPIVNEDKLWHYKRLGLLPHRHAAA